MRDKFALFVTIKVKFTKLQSHQLANPSFCLPGMSLLQDSRAVSYRRYLVYYRNSANS